MTEVLFAALGALGGVIVGSLLRGAVEHRLWLQDARRDAYAAYLHALDRLDDATEAYMRTFCFLLKRVEEEREEEASHDMAVPGSSRTASELEAEWRAVKGAQDQFQHERARVDLLGSDVVNRTTTVVDFNFVGPSPPESLGSPLWDPEALSMECQRWRDGWKSRYEWRKRFVDRAGRELRASPWEPGRSSRRLWAKVGRRVKRLRSVLFSG